MWWALCCDDPAIQYTEQCFQRRRSATWCLRLSLKSWPSYTDLVRMHLTKLHSYVTREISHSEISHAISPITSTGKGKSDVMLWACTHAFTNVPHFSQYGALAAALGVLVRLKKYVSIHALCTFSVASNSARSHNAFHAALSCNNILFFFFFIQLPANWHVNTILPMQSTAHAVQHGDRIYHFT